MESEGEGTIAVDAVFCWERVLYALSGVLVRPLKEPASLKAKIKNPSA